LHDFHGRKIDQINSFTASGAGGEGGEINLLVEVTGEKKKDKAAKIATARTLWMPAINNHGGFGRWAFLEIADSWDAQNAIRDFLADRMKMQEFK